MRSISRTAVGTDGAKVVLWLGGTVTTLLAGVCVYCFATGERFRVFARDPAVLHQFSPLDGLLSHAGVMLWAATASVCLFAAFVLRRMGAPTAVRRCLLVAGLFNLVLMADDLLMLHEHVIPRRLGIPEPVVLGTYVVVAAAWLVAYRRVLLAGPWGILAGALGLFAISVMLDLFWPYHTLEYLLEDGAKLLGLSLWASYFVVASSQYLLGHTGLAGSRPGKRTMPAGHVISAPAHAD